MSNASIGWDVFSPAASVEVIVFMLSFHFYNIELPDLRKIKHCVLCRSAPGRDRRQQSGNCVRARVRSYRVRRYFGGAVWGDDFAQALQAALHFVADLADFAC
ncbi:MAG: hypothetical protein Q8Q81_15030 [Oxalobacteraceae bacterium]|nr:hypothetical protein [Oxalobacteraceae bacterium]